IPVTKPGAPAGGLDLRFDPDANVWLGMMYQGAVVKLDRKSGKFQTWTAPGFMENNEARLAMVDPKHLNLDGKVWIGGDNEYRLDPKTNEWYTVDYARGLPKDGPPADRLGSYGVISDSKNNFYGTNFGGQYIIRIDAKTLNVTPFPTPTPNSAPRRGHMDPQDRLWFAEYRGNMIGVFDTKIERTREWAVPSPWSNPYDAISDKDGFAWTGGMSHDQYPPRHRGQHDLAADFLGRQQPRRRTDQGRNYGVASRIARGRIIPSRRVRLARARGARRS